MSSVVFWLRHPQCLFEAEQLPLVQRNGVYRVPKNNTSRILSLLFLGVLMAALDIAIIGPALPAIRDAFQATDRAVVWVFTTYLLFNLIGTPIMAKLSDRLGRRDVYIADVLLFVLGSVVVALAPSLWWVIVGRGIQGFGAGGIFPVAAAVIGDTFPPERRGRALGIIGSVFGVAFLVGPVLAGVVLHYFSWHMLFWGPVPFALVLIPLAWRWLPAQGTPARGRMDALGMAMLAGVLAALAFALNQLDAKHLAASLRSPQVVLPLALGVLLLFVLAKVEREADDPIIHPALFGSRQLLLANALAFGAGVIEGSTVFIPALLVAAFGVSESRASFMLLPMVATLSVGAPLFGHGLDRVGSRLVIIVGTLLAALGTLALGFFSLTPTVFYLAAAAIGFGLSALLGAPLRYIMLGEAPRSERAAAQALIAVMTKVGQMLAAAAVGAVAASMGGGAVGYSASFQVLGGVALLLFVLALFLKRRHEEVATRQA